MRGELVALHEQRAVGAQRPERRNDRGAAVGVSLGAAGGLQRRFSQQRRVSLIYRWNPFQNHLAGRWIYAGMSPLFLYEKLIFCSRVGTRCCHFTVQISLKRSFSSFHTLACSQLQVHLTVRKTLSSWQQQRRRSTNVCCLHWPLEMRWAPVTAGNGTAVCLKVYECLWLTNQGRDIFWDYFFVSAQVIIITLQVLEGINVI